MLFYILLGCIAAYVFFTKLLGWFLPFLLAAVFAWMADPLVGYFYKMYVLGVPQDAAQIWVKMGAVTTAVNAVIAVAVASVLYMALMPALRRSRLLPKY